MLFYAKMRWALKGMTFDELWQHEGDEARAAIQTIESGMAQHLYKVSAEQVVMVIADLPTAEELDRTAMGRLPMHEYLIFEEVVSLEQGFSLDVQGYLRPRRERLVSEPRLLYFIELAWDERGQELDKVWAESCTALQNLEGPQVVSWYRAAGQQRAFAVVDVKEAAELNTLTRHPVLALPRVARMESIRDYHLFAQDVWANYKV